MNELVKDGKINLGFANGWDSKWGNIYKQLREMEIPGTHETRERGRCWYEYRF